MEFLDLVGSDIVDVVSNTAEGLPKGVVSETGVVDVLQSISFGIHCDGILMNAGLGCLNLSGVEGGIEEDVSKESNGLINIVFIDGESVVSDFSGSFD